MFNASWMVASEVATTCTSRIAMNMPMHIMAKTIQIFAVTASVALFSVTEIMAQSRTLAAGRSISAQPRRHKPTARDMQMGIGVLRCPILGQSEGGQSDIPRNSGDLTALSAVASDGETPLCLIF